MVPRSLLSTLAVALAVTFSSIAAPAAKDYVPPRPPSANTFPSKDAHSNEKVTAALDLYDTAPKSQIFTTAYAQEGILPVLLIVTNDGDQPISVNQMRAELVTAGHTKLEALDTDDVYRRVAHIQGDSAGPTRVGPISISGNKNKKAQKQYEEIMAAHFAAEGVEPHTTRSGFLFFDIQDVKQPVAGAHLYLTRVLDASGNELLYFDIPVIPSNAAGSE